MTTTRNITEQRIDHRIGDEAFVTLEEFADLVNIPHDRFARRWNRRTPESKFNLKHVRFSDTAPLLFHASEVYRFLGVEEPEFVTLEARKPRIVTGLIEVRPDGTTRIVGHESK